MKFTTCLTVFSCFCLSASVVDAAPPQVIAHRGASKAAPENTLAAIKLGFEEGADFVEVDLRLTSDKQIVLMHDARTKRTGDADLEVAEHTLEELKRVEVGAFKGPSWAGEKIPTLEEALAVVPAGRGIFLEIKVGPEIVPPLVRAVERSQLSSDQIVLIAFNLPTLIAARQRLPDHRAYWLVSFKQDRASGSWQPGRDQVIARAAGRVDGINLQAGGAVDADFVVRSREASLPLYVWTVNDGALADRMAAAGVAGITTDRPKWLKERIAVAK